MDSRPFLFLLLLATAVQLGCNRSDTSTAPTNSSPASASESEMVQDETEQSTTENTLATREPESGQEVIQAMQDRLHASIIDNGTSDPSPDAVESAITFGKAQRLRFPNDDNLSQALAAIMYQSIRLLKSDPKKLLDRQLETGKMAREILARPNLDGQIKETLSFHLLEEAKALAQQTQLDAAWKSIQESRELGFRQPELFYFDPAFEQVIQNEGFAAEIQSWLDREIDNDIKLQNQFPVAFEMKSLEPLDSTDPVEPEPAVISFDDFKDKEIILVNFWGTWNGPCRAAIPDLVALQEKFKDQLAVVGMTFEQPIGSASFEEARAKVTEFRKSQPFSYPVGYGDFDPRSVIPQFQGYPTILFVDKQGNARLMLSGYHPLAVLETAVRRVLASQ